MNLSNEVTLSQRQVWLRLSLLTSSLLAIVLGFVAFNSAFFSSSDVRADEGQNQLNGRVVDQNGNSHSNMVVELFSDINGNSKIDRNDILIQTYTTGDDGRYTFDMNKTGSFHNLQIRVDDYADDASENETGEVEINDNDLHLGYWLAACRFQKIDLPPQAEIKNARIRFIAQDDKSGHCSCKIWGEKSVNSEMFRNEIHHISQRPKTNSFVQWSPERWITEDTVYTPSLNPIIQEIIEEDGWKAGNSLVLMFENSDGHRDAYSMEGNITKAPVLSIDYRLPNQNRNFIVRLKTDEIPNGYVSSGVSQYTFEYDPSNTNISQLQFDFTVQKTLQTSKNIVLTSRSKKDKTELKWTSANTAEGSHFEIQKSQDSINWEILDELAGQPGDDPESEYESADYYHLDGVAYYRIKQVTTDGRISFSNVLSTKPTPYETQQVDVYPVPANDYLHIRPNSGSSVHITITDDQGRVIHRKTANQLLTINTSAFANGNYMVRTEQQDHVETKRIRVQH